MNRVPLSDLADVIRSKNAGPYELTLDVMFKRRSDYEYLKRSGFFDKKLIADLYSIATEDISSIIFFDPAFALKITMVRPNVSGDPGDTDVYGAQQHAPLLGLSVPMDVGGRRKGD